jgi:hypothetical protein
MGLPSFNELDLIQDPETGLALLARCWGEATPVQEFHLLFWRAQFTHLREWLAGDVMAVAHAVTCCAFYKKRPPLWLCRASRELGARCRPGAEKREHRELANHYRRWEAVELVRGKRPWDPRNYERKVRPDDVWAEAAKLVAGTDAEASEETVDKSHALVRRAGGALVTLPNYRREVEVRERRRARNRRRTKKN